MWHAAPLNYYYQVGWHIKGLLTVEVLQL